MTAAAIIKPMIISNNVKAFLSILPLTMNMNDADDTYMILINPN